MVFTYIGYGLICLGLLFGIVGIIGLLRFRSFYPRIAVTGKLDTIGFLLIMIGVVFIKGISFFSLKVILILAFGMITNPLATHAIARSAYKGGFGIKEKKDGD